MNRTYKYALTAVLGAALALPAFAQTEGYKDVPENHWAYEALVKLKAEGLLVGYPDGEFKGKRLTTRYELAAAIWAVYQNLRNITDSLDSQIKVLQSRGGGTDGGASAAEIQALRDSITALQSDVNTLKGYGDEIATLRKLTDQFQKELQSLGVDVEAMKQNLSDLNKRVGDIEARMPTVKITGDANLFISAGFAQAGGVGVNQDGRVFGFNRNGPNAAGFEDLSVIHDLGIGFSSTNETGPRVKGTLVIGNGYVSPAGNGFGNQSDYAAFVNTQYVEGDSTLFLQNLEVSFPTSVGGLGFNARVGRIGYKSSPMMVQRIDNTSFFSNDRWDNGLYMIDGAEVGFDFLKGKLNVILARTSQNGTTSNQPFQPLTASAEQRTFLGYQGIGNTLPGGFPVSRIMGVDFTTNLLQNGTINAAYLILDADESYGTVGSTGGQVNRLELFGGDIKMRFGGIDVGAGYGQVNFKDDSRRSLTENNKYYQANVGYAGDRFGLWGGYRHIETNYVAPGDWGRYGLIRNPTNVKGFNVGGSLNLTPALSLNGTYEQLEQILTGDGEIRKFAIELKYNLPSGVKLLGGYEDTRFEDFGVLPTSQYRFTTVGLGYNFTTNSMFSLTYQYGDVENDFVIGNARGTGGSFSGGFVASQLSVKF